MDHDETGYPELTRRTLLSGVALGTVALAGCVGGGSDDQNGNESNGGDDNSNESNGGDDNSNESNGNQSVADGEFEGADGGVAVGAPELADASVPVLGNPDAPVTLAVYEDFLCPHCRDYNKQSLPTIATEYIDPDRIRYEHRTFPVVHEQHSWEAANAAYAVFEEYGNEAFWAYKSRLFDRQGEVPGSAPAIYGEIADEMGLDGDAIQTAATDRVHDDDIKRDQSRGQERGVPGTPAFVVNGELVRGTLEQVMGRIDSALDENGGSDGNSSDDSGTDGRA